MLATLGVMPTGEPEIDQCIEVRIGNGKDVTTAPTVTPIGSSELFVLFMPERDAAGSTISSGDVNIGFVNELHDFLGFINEKPRARRRVSHWVEQ